MSKTRGKITSKELNDKRLKGYAGHKNLKETTTKAGKMSKRKARSIFLREHH